MIAAKNMDVKQLKKMFGTKKAPGINLSLQDIPLRAQEMVGKMSISGVQPKLSVKLDGRREELILAGDGGEYILKPQVQRFSHIPENENCCMSIAAGLGIEAPPQCLLPLTDATLAYVVKRFDRTGAVKIHQEDFFQILEKKDKYQGSLEQIGSKIQEISTVPGLDAQYFFERVVLNFLLGNGDAHFKNFSVLYHENKDVRLSPVYDIVCSKLVIPGEEDSTLTMNGKKNGLVKSDFDALADRFAIPRKSRYILFEGKIQWIKDCIGSSRLPVEFKKKFIEIVVSRFHRLDILD